MNDIAEFYPLIGRVLLGALFLQSGISKLTNWSGTKGYMVSTGLVATPLLLSLTILIESLGGLALILGYYAAFSGMVLALFLVPVTIIFHKFWQAEGMERQNQRVAFLKNLAIIGGLLFVAAHGAGPLSLG